MNSRATERRDQNEQVVTFTLVEFLTALVFIAMALGLILKAEALRDINPTQGEILRLRKEILVRDTQIRELKHQIVLLTKELEDQRSLVLRLMAKAGTPLPANDYVVVPKGEYDQSRNAQMVSEEQQREIARLQREIAALRGGGSVTLPRCTTNPGMLVNIRLNGDGSFSASPAWPTESAASVARVDGIRGLTSANALSRSQFLKQAARIDSWGESQSPPCAFAAIVTRGHASIDLYLRQLATVEQHFYVRRAR